MGDLVLRSINLPRSLDEVLRVIAFHERRAKSELMRDLLEAGISAYRERLAAWAPGLLDELSKDEHAAPAMWSQPPQT